MVLKTILIILLFTVIAYAEPVTLAWDRNAESSVIGYKLSYWKKEAVVDTGNETMVTVDVTPLEEYMFAVQAYTADDINDYSEKITYTVPQPSCNVSLCH